MSPIRAKSKPALLELPVPCPVAQLPASTTSAATMSAVSGFMVPPLDPDRAGVRILKRFAPKKVPKESLIFGEEHNRRVGDARRPTAHALNTARHRCASTGSAGSRRLDRRARP